MAKDGTLRGGARPGSGPKKKAISEKIMEGNRSHEPMKIIDFGDRMTELEGRDMPKPSEYLSDPQAGGEEFGADRIYEEVCGWLSERGCASLIEPQLIERYAVAHARWIQCERVTSEKGFLAKHPSTGEACQSPYVSMSDKYMSQANRIWCEIFQIVKENCLTDYKGASPQDDMMDSLLKTRKG